MARDPQYGSSSRGDYENEAARVNAQADLFKKREAAVKRLSDVEGAYQRQAQTNVGARREVAQVVDAGVKSLTASAEALERENKALLENTGLWQAQAGARVGAVRAAAAGTSTVDYGTSQRADYAPAVAATDSKAAAYARARGQAESLAKAEAALARVAPLNVLESSGPFVAGRAIESPRSTSVVERPGTDIVPYDRSQLRQLAAGPPPLSAPTPSYGPVPVGVNYGGAGSPPPPTTKGLLAEADATAKASFGQRTLAQDVAATNASLLTLDARQAAANAGWRQSVAEVANASNAISRHGALTTDFLNTLVRGEATLGEFGTQLTQTIGKFAGWAIAGGLVYTAFEALKRIVQGATATQTGVAQLERAGLDNFSKGQAEQSYFDLSKRLNVPIHEAANAEFYATRAGYRTQPEAASVGETALLAQKLDLVPVQDADKAFGALRASFGASAEEIRNIFNILDVGQREFNARIQQTLPYMGRAAASWKEGGGNLQQLAQQMIILTGAIGGGGGGSGAGSPATFFTRLASNVRKPASEEALRQLGFDPAEAREHVGDFFRTLQRAAREGVTPAGLPFGSEQRFRAAEAISGPALAPRYGIQTIEAGRTGRAEEVEKLANAEKARGAVQSELEHKLSQFDEKLAAVGYEFERIGGALGQSGVVTAASDLLGLFGTLAGGMELVAGPLSNLARVFTSLPTAVQQAALAAGAATAITRFAQKRALAGGEELDERGLLALPARDALRYARRTTSEGLRSTQEEARADAQRLKQASIAEANAVGIGRRFRDQYGVELNAPGTSDERRAQLVRQNAGIEAQIANSAVAREAAAQRLLSTNERIIALEGTEVRLKNRQVSERERVKGYLAEDNVAARAGTFGPLLAGEGVTGANFAARGGDPAVTRASGLILPSAAIRKAGVETADALTVTDQNIEQASVELKGAMASFIAAVEEGAIRTKAAVTEGYAAGGVKGATLAPVGLGAGALASGFSKLGANAGKALLIGFIGSALAELAGEAASGVFGKNTGSVISGLGSDVAIGAGLGTLVGQPVLGALAGAAFYEGEQFLGGESAAAKTSTRKKKVEERKRAEGRSQAEAEAAATQDSRERVLEETVSSNEEVANKSKASVAKEVKAFAATVKVFGAHSAEGKQAASEMAAVVAGTFLNQAQGYGKIGNASELFDQAFEGAVKSNVETLKTELKAAHGNTGAQHAAIASAVGNVKDIYSQAIEQQNVKLENVAAANNIQQEALKKYQASYREGLSEAHEEGLTGKEAEESAKAFADETSGQSLVQAERNYQNAITKYKQEQANLPKLAEKVKEAEEQFVEVILASSSKLIDAATKFKVLNAGADGAAVVQALRGAASKYGAQIKFLESLGIHGEALRPLQTKQKEEADTAANTELEKRDNERKLQLAKIPGSDKTGRANKTLSDAQQHLAEIRAKKGEFKPKDLEDAEIAVAEAENAAFENSADESKKIIEATGALRKAQAFGSGRAEAAAEIQTAQELVGAAKTRSEQIQAQARLQDAYNAAQRAGQDHIRAEGELAESKTGDTLAKDRIKIATDKRLLKTATPDERLKLLAQGNDEQRKYREDIRGEKESVIDYELKTHEISPQQAVSKYQALLQAAIREKASAKTIRDLKLKIYEEETNQIQELIVGNIKLPTYFGARTLTANAQAAAGLPIGGGYTAIPGSVLHNSTTHNTVTIHVHDAHDPEATAKHIHRELRRTTKAHRRSAGIVR